MAGHLCSFGTVEFRSCVTLLSKSVARRQYHEKLIYRCITMTTTTTCYNLAMAQVLDQTKDETR